MHFKNRSASTKILLRAPQKLQSVSGLVVGENDFLPECRFKSSPDW